MTLYLRGIGILVGLIFGAGVFGLPYAFSQAGLFWGAATFVVTLFIIVYLHMLYGEVAFFTKGTHRYTSYAEIFLGKSAKQLAFITTIASYYGSLLVYGLLGGQFLHNIVGDFSSNQLIWAFFVVAGFLVLMSLEKLSSLNFYLTFPIFAFIIYLFVIALPFMKTDNFLVNNGFVVKDWFLPYGVWLFSLSGFATIPETKDIFKNSSIKKFKRVIWISILSASVFYLLFTATVLGVSGAGTTQDALAGISVLGANVLLIGSIIGFFAVFTSYLALAEDMKNIFIYDYKANEWGAWIVTVVPPAIFFGLGAVDFTKILSFVGAVGMGVVGFFVILMSRSLRKKIKAGDFTQVNPPQAGDVVKERNWIDLLVLVGIFAGVVYELWGIFL